MDKKQMKIAGIACLVICAICVFVAIERYSANAGNVRAINNFQRNSPLGGMGIRLNVKPAMPAATKYAIFLAVLSGVGGGILLFKSKQEDSPSVRAAEPATSEQ